MFRYIVVVVALVGTACDGGDVDDAGQTDPDAGPDPTMDAGAAPADAGDAMDSGPRTDAMIDAAAMGDGGEPEVDAGSPAPNVVFVTSERSSGDLGGVAGADATCNRLASAAGLGGTYVAWLSTSTIDARTRLGTASGWVRPDGEPVADSQADLLAGQIFHPINVTEAGDPVIESDHVWNATRTDGTHIDAPGDCEGWTSDDSGHRARHGSSFATTGGWTGSNVKACSERLRLYCFGVDRAAAVAPVPETGRTAFVSRNVPVGAGLASLDLRCNSEATSAGLPGTYRAFVATDGATIASRFATGQTYVRTDGVRVSSRDLFTGGLWDAPINVEADGTTYVGAFALWTGVGAVENLSAPGTTASTCASWTTSAPASQGRTGALDTIAPNEIAGSGSSPCSFGAGRVLCLED